MNDKTLALWSAAAGAVLAAGPVFQRLILVPVYLNEGHDALALINRLSAMLVLPGKAVVFQVWPPPEHFFLTRQLVGAAAFNFLFYSFLILLLMSGVRRYRWNRKQLLETTNQQDADVAESADRRTFLATAAAGTAGFGVMVTGLYPILVEPGWLKVRRLAVSIPDLPASLHGITIVQITDVHHDEWISAQHVRAAVELANSLSPDIVVLTGDYVTANSALIKPAITELSRLTSRIGTLAVLGNHDWWCDADEVQRHFTAVGIPLIDNNRRFVTPERRLSSVVVKEGLCIGGVGDLWTDDVAPERAFLDVPETMPRLLLSHNPDVAEQENIAAGRYRVDLMLSGHTHGGQVRLPGLGTPIVPSAFGSRYSYGLVRGPGCRVNISSGIGMAMLPVRLNVRPEIVLITLQA